MTEITTTTERLGTLEHFDPASLVLDENVRQSAELDKPFLDSLTEHGVLVPITAVRRDDGTVAVRNGQRRYLGAREVGLASVPVYVTPVAAADTDDQTVQRVVHQIVTNDQKSDLNDADRARGIQQMLDSGMSVAKAAKALSIKRDTVKAAATAAQSDAALQALAVGQLSMAEAAALAEFEGDEDALARLTRAAGTNFFEHTAARIRQEREIEQAQRSAAQPYAQQGYTVLAERPRYGDPSCVALDDLRTTEGQPIPLSVDTTLDPERWAVMLVETVAFSDRDTGEPVDAESIDFDTEYDDDAEAEEGKRHFSTVTEIPAFEPEWFCTDYQGLGYEVVDHLKARIERAGAVDHGSDAQARADRDAEKAEHDARQRRMVLALNRLGAAAQSVRRAFVAEKLLGRKTAPKGAAIFISECLSADPLLLQQNHSADLAAELLGVKNGAAIQKLIANLPASGDGRAQVITLALVLGACEARTPKDAWRSGHCRGVGAPCYLKFLAANGYTLAPVEDINIGMRTADEVYDNVLREKETAAV